MGAVRVFYLMNTVLMITVSSIAQALNMEKKILRTDGPIKHKCTLGFHNLVQQGKKEVMIVGVCWNDETSVNFNTFVLPCYLKEMIYLQIELNFRALRSLD